MSKAFTLGSEGALARTGGSGNFRGLVAEFFEALGNARHAQSEYKRQVARGIEPSEAVRAAFDMCHR